MTNDDTHTTANTLTRTMRRPLHKHRLLLSLTLLALSPSLSVAQLQTTLSPSPTPAPTEESDPTSIYITIIIIVSILCVAAICLLIYRMYRRRQSAQNSSHKVTEVTEQKNQKNVNGKGSEHGNELEVNEQVKFRGSMSSVENRHERVPSKPMVMTITTPKGTRHVADAFGEYDQKEDDLPGIDEDGEEEYATTHKEQTQNQTQTQNSTENGDPPESGPMSQGVEVTVHSESAEE